ncbi:MAG: prolipoprotein diacylglyceryl transferase [Myxococcales bacterium]|nr:MAG: prolipoprotein diacylglyceryl transferase [Myxococcales bacterium]
MHPILFELDAFDLFGFAIGPVSVHTYGVLVAAGFALATFVGARFAKQDGIDVGRALDLAFWALVSGMVGARLMYSVVNWRAYADACSHPEKPNLLNFNLPLDAPACWDIFKFWEGGLVWYGGLLGALLACSLLARRWKLPYAKTADIALGAVPLGHAIGRLGCLCAGCCYGQISDGPLGLTFPPGSMPYMAQSTLEHGRVIASLDLPLHPTQLYEATGELGIFLILLAVRHWKRFDGQVALGFLILYPLLRSTVEFFRGDYSRGLLVSWKASGSFGGVPYQYTTGISSAQVVSLFVVVGALLWMARLLKHARPRS